LTDILPHQSSNLAWKIAARHIVNVNAARAILFHDIFEFFQKRENRVEDTLLSSATGEFRR